MQADWMAPIVLYDDMQSLESKKKDCLLCNMMFVALKSRSAQRIHEVQDYEVWAFCGVSSPALKPLPSDEDELRAQVSKLRFDELVVGLRPRGGKQTEDLKEKRALDKLTAKLEVHEMPSESFRSLSKIHLLIPIKGILKMPCCSMRKRGCNIRSSIAASSLPSIGSKNAERVTRNAESLIPTLCFRLVCLTLER